MANKKNQTKQQQMRNENDYSAFKTVLFYCLLILILPLVTFWVLKNLIFDDYLNLDPIKSNIYSAVAAIVVLHIALGLYIYRAYFEGDQTVSLKKQE